jgi:hypothetical protein
LATWAVHFLTIVGRPGDEAAAAYDKMVANRLRLARENPDDDFDADIDPLRDPPFLRESEIARWCEALIETAHSLPTLWYSQFVHNFAGPRRIIDMLGPDPERSLGPAGRRCTG